jgi:hypothetical protein
LILDLLVTGERETLDAASDLLSQRLVQDITATDPVGVPPPPPPPVLARGRRR